MKSSARSRACCTQGFSEPVSRQGAQPHARSEHAVQRLPKTRDRSWPGVRLGFQNSGTVLTTAVHWKIVQFYAPEKLAAPQKFECSNYFPAYRHLNEVFDEALMSVTNQELALTALRSCNICLKSCFPSLCTYSLFSIKHSPLELAEFWNFPHFYIFKHVLMAFLRKKCFFYQAKANPMNRFCDFVTSEN